MSDDPPSPGILRGETGTQMANPIGGSRKHLLDLLDSERYPRIFNELLAEVGAVILLPDERRPIGKGHHKEMEIPVFCREVCPDIQVHEKTKHWWLPRQPGGRGGKGATWDLLSTVTIGGKRGLLLVEAKAHETELLISGKSLKSFASVQSKINHEHISNRLTEISESLNRATDGGFSLSIDTNFQLANRVAWGWKLAESGVPVVLLYLGFIGDTHFRSDYFRDSDHWQRAMDDYMSGVLPPDLPSRVIQGKDGGSLAILVKSLPIESAST